MRLTKSGCAAALAKLVDGRDASVPALAPSPLSTNHRIHATAKAAGIQGAMPARFRLPWYRRGAAYDGREGLSVSREERLSKWT